MLSYTVLAFSSQLVISSLSEIMKNPFSWQAILSSLLGLAILLLFTFIDWRELLENKKLKLNFRIWTWTK
jgi:hypothetical protein